MATKRPDYSWENGYQEVATRSSWVLDGEAEVEESDDYVPPPSTELVTSTAHNDLGVNVILSWPTLYDGTNSPHGTPSWWQPQEKVDVLICGGKDRIIYLPNCELTDFTAGPSGLALALSLARQGVSFRIIGEPVCNVVDMIKSCC